MTITIGNGRVARVIRPTPAAVPFTRPGVINGVWLKQGPSGPAGQSAYQQAVAAGFSGTLAQWLESLNGEDGDPGAGGVGVPGGGATGQALLKASGADYDTEWGDAASGGGGGLLGYASRTAASSSTYTVTSTSPVDVDATNLAVTFTAPDSGVVVVNLRGVCSQTANTWVWWLLREGTTNLAGTERIAHTGSAIEPESTAMRRTGLTPGNTYTYKWAWRVTSGTGTLHYGATEFTGTHYGPLTMEVWSG